MARASRPSHPRSPLPYFLLTNPAGPEAEYQLNQNGSVDISRRELSAPAGARYLRKPDENEDRPHGAVGPRAFVMPLDVDQMNLGPPLLREDPFQAPPPGLEPRQRVPKTRVLPLHHGGMAKKPCGYRQVSIMPHVANTACLDVSH